MKPAAVIRRAEAADLGAVAELAISRAGGDREAWVQRLKEDLIHPQRALWVAGRVVGYGRAHRFRSSPDAPALIAPDGFYLIGLGIAEGCRRQGLGRSPTRARLEWIASRATDAWFFTNARNEASLRLNAQLGFREVTREFEYPGVRFEGGVGVLCSVQLEPGQTHGFHGRPLAGLRLPDHEPAARHRANTWFAALCSEPAGACQEPDPRSR